MSFSYDVVATIGRLSRNNSSNDHNVILVAGFSKASDRREA